MGKQGPVRDERLKKDEGDRGEKDCGKPSGLGKRKRKFGPEPMAKKEGRETNQGLVHVGPNRGDGRTSLFPLHLYLVHLCLGKEPLGVDSV